MAVILPSAMPATATPTAAVPATAAMPATAAVASTFSMASTFVPAVLAVAFTLMPAVLAMAFAFMPAVVPPSPSALPGAIGIGVSEPPMRRPTVVRPPVPKPIRPHGPIIPVLQALVLTHRVQIGLLHVIDDLIGYALIAELCQLRWRQAIDGL
jgi:hypothetical protein